MTYDPDYPGNVINIKTYDVDEVTVLSETDITYDDVWQAFPATISVGDKRQEAAYDSRGRVVSYRNIDDSFTTDLQKTSATTEVVYDALGRPVTTILPLQTVAQTAVELDDRPQRIWTYDDDNRQVIYTGENGVATEVEYDGLGRIVVEKQPGDANVLALYTAYDSLGRVASETDALYHTTSYRYDGLGRKTNTIFTDSSSQRTWYVDAGPLPVNISMMFDLTPPNEYDGLPWVRWERHDDEEGQSIYRGYDVVGRLVWEAGNLDYVLGIWEITWFEYDRFDNLIASYIRRDTSGWDKTAYEYDLFKTPTVLDMPGSTESIHTYTYDSRGLKTSEDSGTTSPIAWQYDEHGRPTKVVYGSTTEVRFAYEKEDQLDKVVAKVVVGGVEQSAVTQVFNLRGWLASERWAFDNKTYTLGYEYDDVGNVTKIDYPEGYTSIGYNPKNLPIQIGREADLPLGQFTYEANGLLQSTLYSNGVGTQYTYTDRNRLQTLSSVPLSLGYSYTLSGNVQSINDHGVTLYYSYDGANRLVSSETKTPNGVVAGSYTYDLAGNRLS
jgi:YD repeat-containing protein